MKTLRVAGILLALAPATAMGQEIRPVPRDDHKHLALDPRLFDSAEGARLAMGRIEKERGNPLFTADKPWENSFNNLYPNVDWDPEARRFRMWYKCVLADKDAIARMMPPATVHDVGWFLLYAESDDGLSWRKPELGLVGFDGSMKTNIVARDTPNVGVFRDGHDANPDRRYKMIYDVGLGKLRVRFSPNGIRWGEPQEPVGFTPYTGDTHNNAFWDERGGRYVAITRFFLGERLVARSESRDFLHWEETRLALRSTLEEGKAEQLYCMPTFPYGSGYLGLLMVYNVGTDRTVDCELAWSSDTVQWRRVLPGTPFIPRGPAGSFDAGCIYGQSGPPVLKDGRLMLFYGGSEAVHRGWKRHCSPCAVTLRPDGFAAMEPAGTSATLVTAPLRAAGGPLRISADAKGGAVRIEAVGVSGFEKDACEPVTADVTDAPVRWKGGASFESLKGREVRLKITLEGPVRLFSVGGVDLMGIGLPEPARPERRGPRPGGPVVRRESFDGGAEGWQGTDRAEAVEGTLRVTRPKGAAIAAATSKSSAGRFCGDLEAVYGPAVRISFRIRSKDAAKATQLELFAKEISQWSHSGLPAPGAEWTPASVTLRPDWTDAEARAAGWQPAINAFPWGETARHVGRVVVMPLFSTESSSFDIDDFTMETAPE